MFRHVVLFRWISEATAQQQAALSSALEGLPAVVPSIRTYRFGADAGVNDGNHQFAVVADFDDVAGYVAYRDHPAHRAVMVEHIAPILADRASVQYEFGD